MAVLEIEKEGETEDDGAAIVFDVETRHVRLHPDQPVLVRWVYVDADTNEESLTVKLVLDDTEVSLGYLNTDTRERTAYAVNRWGRVAGVRITSVGVNGGGITSRVTIYGVELDVHNPQEPMG